MFEIIYIFPFFIETMKMSRKYLVLFLIACVLVLTLSYVIGFTELLFPSMFLLGFLVGFLLSAYSSSIQAEANPGLEELEEPDYFFSKIYDAWLYVNDRRRWASYTCLWSCVFGGLLGVMFGVPTVLNWKLDFYASLVSWLSGMFLIVSMAGLIAKSDYWSEVDE